MVMSRRIPAESNLRCDYCHKLIPKGKHAHQITEGKAQGIYHGRQCYEAALAEYENLQKENHILDDDIEF